MFIHMLTEAFDNYLAVSARLKNLLVGPDAVDDTLPVSEAKRVLLRCYVTEFECKASRHALRSRKPKQQILDRTSSRLS